MKIYVKEGFVTDNSNECEAGCYFVKTATNAKFEAAALAKGAKIINLAECKQLLGIDESIKIIGITGTNGKTTTAAVIYATLLNLGYGCGLCGTRGAFINGERIDDKALTTSEILRTLSYLKFASERGCEYFVMEASSHAIAQKRIESLEFAMKIFTNLTQDHLDYHGTFEEYARVKSEFFADDAPKLINADDRGGIKFNPANALTYALHANADFAPGEYSLEGGIHVTLKTPRGQMALSSNLHGEFNLCNLIAAVACVATLTDRPLEQIARAASKFDGVEGRMEVVSRDPLMIVDFAHTPDGIEKVLNALRHRKIVAVFGAGGDRDRTKRPKMGAIAQKYAHRLVVTSDNPRSEEPESIIAEICGGLEMNERVKCIANRKEAIKYALESLAQDEILVILGKGDETYQEIKGVKYPFSDKQVVREILDERT